MLTRFPNCKPHCGTSMIAGTRLCVESYSLGMERQSPPSWVPCRNAKGHRQSASFVRSHVACRKFVDLIEKILVDRRAWEIRMCARERG